MKRVAMIPLIGFDILVNVPHPRIDTEMAC